MISSIAPRLRAALGAALFALAALAAGCATTGDKPGHSLADLTNPALSPEYSQWLIGPISRMATVEEVKAFLACKEDSAAEALIRQFWARRNPGNKPVNAAEQLFEARAVEADKFYAEAGFLGRRTDRGAVYVIYGPPRKVQFEVPPNQATGPIELWTYDAKDPKTPSGLNGRKPEGAYRFFKHGDLTIFYLHHADPLARAGLGGTPE